MSAEIDDHRAPSGIGLAGCLFSGALVIIVLLREFFPPGAAEVMGLGLLIGAVAAHKPRYTTLPPHLLAAGALVMLAGMSVAANGMRLDGIRYFAHLGLGALLFGLISSIPARAIWRDTKPFVAAAVAVGLVVVATGALHTAGLMADSLGVLERGSVMRGEGFIQGSNYFAMSMLFALFLAFVAAKTSAWMLIAVAGVAGGLAATFSRGIGIAALVFVIAIAITDACSRKAAALTILVAALVVLLWAAPSIGLYPATWGGEGSEAEAAGLSSRFGDGGGGISMRIDAMIATFDYFASHNWLLGSGRVDYGNLLGLPPHNSYVTMLGDYGVMGLAAFLAVLATVGWRSLMALKDGAPYPLSILLALVVAAGTNDYHLNKEWWLGMGVAVALASKARLTP